jgi:hypothetical protein
MEVPSSPPLVNSLFSDVNRCPAGLPPDFSHFLLLPSSSRLFVHTVPPRLPEAGGSLSSADNVSRYCMTPIDAACARPCARSCSSPLTTTTYAVRRDRQFATEIDKSLRQLTSAHTSTHEPTHPAPQSSLALILLAEALGSDTSAPSLAVPRRGQKTNSRLFLASSRVCSLQVGLYVYTL